jgi:hypothetical protein
MRPAILLLCAVTLVCLAGTQGHTQDPLGKVRPVPAVEESPPSATSSPPSVAPGWDTPTSAVSPKPDVVVEMIQVLQSTQAVDTFFVTLGLLEEMGQKAQPAIPGILRNAERLGLFKSHLTNRDRDTEHVERVVRALKRIRAPETEPVPSAPCVPCVPAR